MVDCHEVVVDEREPIKPFSSPRHPCLVAVVFLTKEHFWSSIGPLSLWPEPARAGVDQSVHWLKMKKSDAAQPMACQWCNSDVHDMARKPDWLGMGLPFSYKPPPGKRRRDKTPFLRDGDIGVPVDDDEKGNWDAYAKHPQISRAASSRRKLGGS